MGYSVETTEDGYVETLTVEGKEYKKRWKYAGLGHYKCQNDDFSEQLENDGCKDEEFLDKIYDRFDDLGLGIALCDINGVL